MFLENRFLLQASQFGAGKDISILLKLMMLVMCFCSFKHDIVLAFSMLCLYFVSGFYGYAMDYSLAATSTALRFSATALSRPRSSRVPEVLYKLASLYQVFLELLLQIFML